MFTIEDWKEGKCALKNDGTREQLGEFFEKASFTKLSDKIWSAPYVYMDDHPLFCFSYLKPDDLPIQSVKDFLWTPKPGELVEFSTDGDFFHKRIYIGCPNGKHHFVNEFDEHNFLNDLEYTVVPWKKVATIRQIKQPEIEITVKVNGKEVPLSDISEETLMKIRKA